FSFHLYVHTRSLHSFPTRRSSDLTRGRGVYLWDSRGKRYLDFLSGIGVNVLGHAHPAIQRVLKQQAGKLIHTSNLFYHQYQSELDRKSTRLNSSHVSISYAVFCLK